MSGQKYRADIKDLQPDGATLWFARWMGGPTLSKINNCCLNMAGAMRRTVYITGEADTFFSIPAVCTIAGCRVKGYVTSDDEGFLYFQHGYYA